MMNPMTAPSRFRLWQPPARFEDRPSERRISFLELFFDLVFVVVVAQLSHRLSEHPTWAGVGWFVALFFAVWSSWTNGTLYYDLHGTNDISVRVFTFAQMLAVAMMGVYIGSVPGEGEAGFALAYAMNVLVLVFIWFRTGIHDPAHRAASNPYSTFYLLSALSFVGSIWVSPPARYWIWALGLVLQVAGQVIAFHRWTPPESQGGDAVIAVTGSLVERLGLFVIIVLGEVIVGSVTGMAELEELDLDGAAVGMLGVLVAIGLWWIYFDLVSLREPISRYSQLWLNLHFPLVVAITAGGAGVLNTVGRPSGDLPDAVRWLLVGAMSVAIVTVAILTRTLVARAQAPEIYLRAELTMYGSAVLALAVGLTDWGANPTLMAMVVLLLAPVLVALYVLRQRLAAADQMTTLKPAPTHRSQTS
jgi:low temperature requirement protein LtrA